MRHVRRDDALGILFVMLAAAGFGIGGPFARIAGDLGFNAVTLSIWRALSALLALGVLLVLGMVTHRVETTAWAAISRRERLQLVAMGAFVAGTTLGLFAAFERNTIALALIVFYTYPSMVAVIAARRLAEPLGPRRIAAIGIASVGMVLVVVAPSDQSGSHGIDGLGLLFAFGAALCQTGYAIVASSGFKSVPALQASTILRGFSVVLYALILLPLVVLVGELDRLLAPLSSPEAWVVVLFLGVFGAALPTAALVSGYRRIGPTRGAVLMLLEPVVGVLLAAIWLAERPAPVQLIGGLLVLAGAATAQLAAVPRTGTTPLPVAE